MTKAQIVETLKTEKVYENLAEIRGMIEQDQNAKHDPANKEMLVLIRRMVKMDDWMVFGAFEMIEALSALRGLSHSLYRMADDGLDLIDDDIAERIDQEWKFATRIIENALGTDAR